MEQPNESTGIIRLQSTPRYDSTLAISKSALALGSQMQKLLTDEFESAPALQHDSSPHHGQPVAHLRKGALQSLAKMAAGKKGDTPLRGEDT